jgi:ketosteroid isomerase-like protein
MNPGIYRGHAGVRDYFGRLAEIVSEQRIESVDVIDVDDDRVIAIVRSFGKTAHFDQEIEANWAWSIYRCGLLEESKGENSTKGGAR